MPPRKRNPPKVYEFQGNYPTTILRMTLAQARSASHQGKCDDDVSALKKGLQDQLDKIDGGDLAKDLKEYGAWSYAELAVREDNELRITWLAACDISEHWRER